MARISTFLPFVALLACGPKKAPAPAAEPEPEPVAAPAPEPEPQPEPEPEPEPEPVVNADFTVTLKRADGSVFSGHVQRVERSTDWWGEADWSTDEVAIEVEGHGTEKAIPWSEVASIKNVPGKGVDAIDCTYDSNYSPWMYTCTLRTTATLKTRSGETWTVVDRHKWRFTLDDGTSTEFWIHKFPVRMQDPEDMDGENPNVYIALQDRMKSERNQVVTSITVK